MSLDKYLTPIDHDYTSERIYGVSVCIDCKNACGGCEWSEINPETGKIRFLPVHGWTAKKTADGYQVLACPKFKPLRGKPLVPQKPVKFNNNIDKAKAVVAIGKDGKETQYCSIMQAAIATRASTSGISKCCKGREGYHTAGGYRWRYAEEGEGNLGGASGRKPAGNMINDWRISSSRMISNMGDDGKNE